jgi:hypothetical protein
VLEARSFAAGLSEALKILNERVDVLRAVKKASSNSAVGSLLVFSLGVEPGGSRT